MSVTASVEVVCLKSALKELNKTQTEEYFGKKKDIPINNVIEYLQENNIEIILCII